MWQEETLAVVEGIVKLLEAGLISKQKAGELIVKYNVYDLTADDILFEE